MPQPAPTNQGCFYSLCVYSYCDLCTIVVQKWFKEVSLVYIAALPTAGLFVGNCTTPSFISEPFSYFYHYNISIFIYEQFGK
jgi:hypothetical protein